MDQAHGVEWTKNCQSQHCGASFSRICDFDANEQFNAGLRGPMFIVGKDWRNVEGEATAKLLTNQPRNNHNPGLPLTLFAKPVNECAVGK